MHLSRKHILAGIGFALLGAGVAQAATEQMRTMQVALPDGSVAHVRYAGDVAPRVTFVPVEADAMDMAIPAAFAQMEQISAMMDRQMAAMMQQAADMQQQALAQRDGAAFAAPGMVMTGTMPQGAHFSYVSTTTDANGCTRSVSYSSDGTGAQPKMTQAASDSCDAAKPGPTAIPAKAEVAAEPIAPRKT